ncbi:AMP-binding enzyme [Novosphingobium sp. ST904]|nr:AMP-binding enzyme [Novosphingobium sp. ST904]
MLRDHLRQSLPDYMVPSAIVMLDALPLTPNGKVDRRGLPAPDASREERGYVAPRTPVEAILAGIWADVLKLDRVGVFDNFFELGGDSIQSIQVVARAGRAGLKIPVRQLFEHQSVAALATVASTAAAPDGAEQGMVDGEVALTPIQSWFFAQEPGTPDHFNQAFWLMPRSRLDPARLGTVLARLVEHHDALRLRYRREPSGWVQFHGEAAGSFALEVADLSALSPDAVTAALAGAAEEFQRGLDLAGGPLVRVGLFELASGAQRLLLVIHHLVVDGVSWRILMEDLEALYADDSAALAPKTTSFKAWSGKLHDYAATEAARAEQDGWREQIEQPVAPLPIDLSSGPNDVASVDIDTVELSADETDRLLKDVPNLYRTRINDVLLTALAQALAGWTGQGISLIHLEGHGREAVVEGIDLSRTVGWFTSLYPVRLAVDPEAGPGRQRVDDRRVLSGIAFVNRTG